MKYDRVREIFGNMPPLRHSLPGQPFDLNRSEVVAWLLSRSEVAKYLFGAAVSSKAIVYDKTTGTWQGRDWRPE
jgi:hypothetical protein